MESEGSLPHSQAPATCPYPQPARSIHTPTSYFLKIHLNITLLSKLGPPKWSLSFRFPHHNPVNISLLPLCAICPAHLILLYFITQTILGEEYRTFSSSLCSFLHSPPYWRLSYSSEFLPIGQAQPHNIVTWLHRQLPTFSNSYQLSNSFPIPPPHKTDHPATSTLAIS